MRNRIEANPCPDILQALDMELPFPISITDSQYLPCNTSFHLETSEYGSSLATFLDYQFIGAEASFVSVFGNVLNAVHKSTAIIVFQDQHDKSSWARLRPDITAFKNRALCLKIEFKASIDLMADARDSLVNKFSSKASVVFPKKSRECLGIIGCPSRVEMYLIRCEVDSEVFNVDNAIRVYLMDSLQERIRFVVDMFKVCRWIASIEGPVGEFHLIPDVRLPTRNKHHITWGRNGLLKEFNDTVSEESLRRIHSIIRLKLPYVEWGERMASSRSILITSIGYMAIHVLGRINDDSQRQEMYTKMIREVRMGLDSLHELGFAHCDLCIDNVFYEEAMNRFFLDDLEYLTPVEDAAPIKNMRLSDGMAVPESAKQLDELNFQSFINEAMCKF